MGDESRGVGERVWRIEHVEKISHVIFEVRETSKCSFLAGQLVDRERVRRNKLV